MNNSGCVSQMHMKGTYHNALLMNRFKIRQIILVRNIYDIVASLFDDLRKKEEISGYHIGKIGYSFLWLDSATKNMNDEDLIDMIIDLAIPWYVNFYVSWYRLTEQNIVNPIWVNYEDMMNDKTNVDKQTDNRIDFSGINGNYSRGEHPNSQANLKPFPKGMSGNPLGRPHKFVKLARQNY